MLDVYNLMKYLTPYELDHLKHLAHNDHIPYEEINNHYKIDKSDLTLNYRFKKYQPSKVAS